eukprot:TRINITY_DN2486_c0_g1_i2.p1 TRINITY_DN2486_c0_g1~~TRINITY_DN2486_c0_g1_i2.p1  ORF type:complete len:153 (-),score=45.46 TRINITY_DN2486_c0_g1_i2:148-606(-)
MSAPKKPSLTIPIPKNFQKIEPAQLAHLLKENHAVTVVDVRDVDFAGGHITKALHVPFSEFDSKVKELAAQVKDQQFVIFNCMYGQLRSPHCALSLIKELGNDTNVFVLSGGFNAFLRLYHGDAALVEGFDKTLYDESFYHVNDTNVCSVRN